jgi:DNA-directed RNA polymerase specialized sigma24 family protein
MATALQLYTRSDHGSMPVVVHDEGDRFEVDYPEGRREFGTSKSFMAELFGHNLNLPWRRYFKVGRYAKPTPTPLESVFALWGTSSSELVVDAGDPILVLSDPALTVDQGACGRDRGRIVVGSTKLGVDLKNRSIEVAKLFYAGFGRRCYHAGYDPEEVLQEVYKGLLTRNMGRCPWDPSKGTFGHYVHMVCHCVLANYHRKESRRRQREQVGIKGYLGGQLVDMDASSVNGHCKHALFDDPLPLDAKMRETTDALVDALYSFRNEDIDLALLVLPLKQEGCTRRQIAHRAGLRPSQVTKAMDLLKYATRSLCSA